MELFGEGLCHTPAVLSRGVVARYSVSFTESM